jgi:hypothetical protein
LSFGISGFGAVQLRPLPQVFQALSLGLQPPVAPAPPYGTVNPTALVPVQRTGNPAVPANLTLAAHGTFAAILKINAAVVSTGQYPLVSKAFTTTALGATNPTLNALEVAPVPPSIPVVGSPPSGPVSFSLTAPPANAGIDADVVTTTAGLLSSKPPAPHTSSPTTTAPVTPAASPGAVAQIVATVKSLAIAAVYPAPVFSFSA